MTKIKREHFRQLGYCRKGTKMLADKYGIDWDQLCGDGVDAEQILETGDGRALSVVEYVRGIEDAE